ncbi:P-type ATPase [Parasponia andersonii]|uniref:Pectinesterase n=1 Tax=Parasponia andersonii TaxID=3476 RepID=A0A2P5E335_PARAD|nr:P-type ATPase [Parasponia andersonii]
MSFFQCYLSLFIAFFSVLGDGLANGQWHTRAGHKKTVPYSLTITVDQSGHGNFQKIQYAINSIPSYNMHWVLIRVKAGIYREKIVIPRDKPYIFLKGEGKSRTQVVWGDHDNLAQSPTFASSADNIVVKAIGFTNSYNHPVNKNPRAPAVAAMVSGDMTKFFRCGFYGLQDTLWDHQGRHYYKHCTIEGAVDFIFGGGQSLFERRIAFAHKEVEVLKDGMTLTGIAGISDPCRPGVTDAVKDLQNAGVNVKMITDDIFTAKAIATECGILTPSSGEVIEDVKFRNYTPEERMKKVDEICVMASTSPSDKLLMVQCLKRNGLVVALAGNGTNNTLVMKEADIGVFMGIQGTEVTDESCDIVILDGNFASIPKVFKWGRCLYSSIQKFIQYQLTTSFACLIANFVGLFLIPSAHTNSSTVVVGTVDCRNSGLSSICHREARKRSHEKATGVQDRTSHHQHHAQEHLASNPLSCSSPLDNSNR